jgi:hypothetical protein
VDAPADRRAADRLEAVAQLVVGGGRGVRARRPHHDLPRRPRRLEAHLAGRVGRGDGGDGLLGVGHLGEEVVGRLQAGQLGLEVGHHLVALRGGEQAELFELVLGVVEQAFQGAPPPGGVGIEQLELLWRGDALCRRPGGVLEHPCAFLHPVSESAATDLAGRFVYGDRGDERWSGPPTLTLERPRTGPAPPLATA